MLNSDMQNAQETATAYLKGALKRSCTEWLDSLYTASVLFWFPDNQSESL